MAAIEDVILPGDAPGAVWRVPVHRFRGTGGGPHAYLQAALHADEMAGVPVLHRLCARLRRAEAAGDLVGDVTVVPHANPIGLQQRIHGLGLGRFDLAARGNFNRDFPLLDRPDAGSLLAADAPAPAVERLKHRLLALALGAEIVLDLHSDWEALPYVYLHAALWPAAMDLAAAMGASAVLLWEGGSGGAFEEAALAPRLAVPGGLDGRLVSTVELRGQAQVGPPWADWDAEGLWRLLAARGVVAADSGLPRWTGMAVPLEHIEIVRAPVGGAICFAVELDQAVSENDTLVEILARPGEVDGTVAMAAPQAGFVLSRTDRRLARPHDDLLKLVCAAPSRTARPGPLEA
jgi:predicted deacylase